MEQMQGPGQGGSGYQDGGRRGFRGGNRGGPCGSSRPPASCGQNNSYVGGQDGGYQDRGRGGFRGGQRGGPRGRGGHPASWGQDNSFGGGYGGGTDGGFGYGHKGPYDESHQGWKQTETGWQNEEENPVISPAILNYAWTKETIDKWNNERRRKYPTLQKGEKAAKIKQVLTEKRQKIQEIRQKQYQERKAESPRVSNSYEKRGGRGAGSGRGRRNRQKNPAKRRYGVYEFPEFDYENDDEADVKDGIFAFCGTKSNENSCRFNENTKPNEDTFTISDEDEEMVHKSKRDETVKEEAIEDSDIDDDPPEMVPISRVIVQEVPNVVKEQNETITNEAVIDHLAVDKEMQSDKKKVSFQDTSSTKKPPIKSIYKQDDLSKDYVRILRGTGRRHEQTFLEKLLEDEILKERYEVLQCLHYVCSNNFFGIGKEENKS